MHPVFRHFRDELSATAIRIFAYIGVVAVIVITGFIFFRTPDVQAAIEPTAWTAVERPFRAFAVSVPEFDQADPDYAIQRHSTGGGRKDVMSWGEADAARSRLMIEIYRPGWEISEFGTSYQEVAARAAALGSPSALKEGPALESKFGRLDTFDFTARTGGIARQCLGFVRAFEEPKLQLAGWYCRGGVEVMDRTVLGCALERLSLMMAASEPKVTELFAKAERRRKLCSQKAGAGQRTANVKRFDWIDTSKEPKLRGRVVTK
jgi:hypothetical protein